VETLTRLVKAGNTYVNRNQICAVVGSQPFGGEGLSGTGPKAGGPNYLRRFTRYPEVAAASQDEQAQVARAHGCGALEIAPGASGEHCLDGRIAPSLLTELAGFELVAFWGGQGEQVALRQALAARDGPIIALVTNRALADYCVLERHVCIDTTAAGGNASLLASSATIAR
jgi:RHH-type proline utilization regulon transcriptional repressor/proline dehydrogenase/delta 1-pyrroline-5-carboxylate dehydrogenase